MSCAATWGQNAFDVVSDLHEFDCDGGGAAHVGVAVLERLDKHDERLVAQRRLHAQPADEVHCRQTAHEQINSGQMKKQRSKGGALNAEFLHRHDLPSARV